MNSHHHTHRCSCCAGHTSKLSWFEQNELSRRDFIFKAGSLTIGGLALNALNTSAAEVYIEKKRKPLIKQALKVQPVLTYSVPKRREATSWREWGGIQTEENANEEIGRLNQELAQLKSQAGFPLEFLPIEKVQNKEKATNLAKGSHDVMLIFAAGGSGQILESLTQKEKWNLMFLRHQPGPVYLWYEIVHPRFLRKTVDDYGQPGFDVNDVVVDSFGDLLQRMRGLYGLKNTYNRKIVAIGNAGGWGQGGQKAPQISRTLWKLNIQDYPYSELGKRIQKAFADQGLVNHCRQSAQAYLAQTGISLQTPRDFVDNAFLLTEVFKDVMEEAEADSLTINSCMGTIMPMSKTTACLPLSLLNDEGYLAFCESDFVVIPSGILLHYISGKPVFLNDPTYPHDQIVTLAHCTAPRKMDGILCEPAKILTHFESDYGAAPKVEMKINQITTNLVPDFDCKKWVGFAATIVGNPFLDICRSQVDVRIHGDGQVLMEQMKGFHWMLSYGDYLNETAYALQKAGVGFLNISKSKLV